MRSPRSTLLRGATSGGVPRRIISAWRSLATPSIERSQMKIAAIGAGNVGGGLANLWERAGHEVQRLGSDGGDVSGVEVALLAVPWGAIGDAIGKAKGIEGKPVIDATNIF